MSTIGFGVKPSVNEYAIMYRGWSGGKKYLKAHSHFAKPRGVIAKPSTSHIWLRPEIIIIETFDLAKERTLKRLVVQLPRYSLKCIPHMRN